MPTEAQIREALKAVIDPELRRDIVELEMVRSIAVKDGGVVDVTVSLTTPGCPIKSHFQTAVVKAVTGLEGVSRCNVGFDVLSDQEKGVLQRKLGRPGGLPEGSLAAGRERDLRRLGQGRRGQVLADRQPRGRAGRGRQARRRARRRRLGLLDPAHARPRLRSPEGQRRAQDHPARRPRPEGHVDRLLRQGGRGRRVARADAAQGAHAVPRGRRVGRARLPPDRPAARHRRRLDDARPAAAAGQVRDRHDPAGRRRRRSRAAPPRWPTRSSSRSRA